MAKVLERLFFILFIIIFVLVTIGINSLGFYYWSSMDLILYDTQWDNSYWRSFWKSEQWRLLRLIILSFYFQSSFILSDGLSLWVSFTQHLEISFNTCHPLLFMLFNRYIGALFEFIKLLLFESRHCQRYKILVKNGCLFIYEINWNLF